MELFENEFVAKNAMRVFLDCGISNMPNGCLCGCGISVDSQHPSSYLFSIEEQNKNYFKKGGYRFFTRKSHLERFLKKSDI